MKYIHLLNVDNKQLIGVIGHLHRNSSIRNNLYTYVVTILDFNDILINWVEYDAFKPLSKIGTPHLIFSGRQSDIDMQLFDT